MSTVIETLPGHRSAGRRGGCSGGVFADAAPGGVLARRSPRPQLSHPPRRRDEDRPELIEASVHSPSVMSAGCRRCRSGRSAALPYMCARPLHDRAAELDCPVIDREECGTGTPAAPWHSTPTSCSGGPFLTPSPRQDHPTGNPRSTPPLTSCAIGLLTRLWMQGYFGQKVDTGYPALFIRSLP